MSVAGQQSGKLAQEGAVLIPRIRHQARIVVADKNPIEADHERRRCRARECCRTADAAQPTHPGAVVPNGCRQSDVPHPMDTAEGHRDDGRRRTSRGPRAQARAIRRAMPGLFARSACEKA
jgi:hypothetical protein